MNATDPDGRQIGRIFKGLKAVKNLVTGKKNLKEIGVDEFVGAVDDFNTITSNPLSLDAIVAAADIIVGTDLNNPKTKTASRSNRLKPDSRAQGDHTTFKTDSDGNITRHETFETNPQNPSGFDSVQSTDVTGPAHQNKVTGEIVPTPHTQGKGIEGGVRPALPEEIPGQ